MAAKLRARLTYDSLPPDLRRDVDRIAEEQWRRYRHKITERLMLAAVLAANDVYGFGEVRCRRLAAAIAEILNGYAEDCYPEGRERGEDRIETMNDAMIEEIKARALRLAWEE